MNGQSVLNEGDSATLLGAWASGSKGASLPRLLYLADVPVEASYHGSALVYRLLQRYPAERLLIVEGGIWGSSAERRLPGVRYCSLRLANRRLLHTRLTSWYSSWLLLTAPHRQKLVESSIGKFEADAVLTVSHGFSWLTAAEFACRRGIPLHLISHDDWSAGMRVLPPLRGWMARLFGSVYRRASSRLCISPNMEQAYRGRYGIQGTVLYPSRAADCPEYGEPPQRVSDTARSFTVAFGGSINSTGYADALRAIAQTLAPIGGRLLIFGPTQIEAAAKMGLDLPNVELRGLVKSEELIARFRDEADVLFVPMSFSASDRENMTVSFPSKLADYTAAGLPLMIYGGEYCSAVRWARDNPGVAAVFEKDDARALEAEVRRLAGDPDVRRKLGLRALELGRRFFAQGEAQRTLYQALGAGPR